MKQMDLQSFNQGLFDFIKGATTPFHAVAIMKRQLDRHGFIQLDEALEWNVAAGNRYYCHRNGSLAAVVLGSDRNQAEGFRMIGAHTDSPSLQLKPNPKENCAPYLVGGVETYGGAIQNTWFDRELSLAGRVVFRSETADHKTVLIDYKRPVAYIPNVAIHLNRSVNDGHKINAQTHLSPILSQLLEEQLPDLKSILLKQILHDNPNELPQDVHGFDLYCYDPANPCYFGLQDEFIAAPRLDNLASCFIGLKSIIEAPQTSNILLICTNHEEIGSRTNSGALGSFTETFLSRLFTSEQEKLRSLHNSFFLSLDNAHASHPNYTDVSDTDHRILLNGGPVIKINANQRYCTTAITASVMRILAQDIEVACQNFVMRSDMVCGSTIGPLISARLGIAAIDMGIPTWGMHSIREVTGAKDPFELFRLAAHFCAHPDLPLFHS